VTTLTLDGMRIPVETGGTSRRARLTIERNGSLSLRAAEDVQRSELQAFLASKRTWIYKKLAEKETLTHQAIAKEIVDGEGFSYLGRNYRLKVADEKDDQARLAGGRLVLPEGLRDQGAATIIDWYKSAGDRWLQPRVRTWCNRVGVTFESLAVVDLGFRWGAAGPQGRIQIHWATMQLKPALVDYILAHEVVHLREPHHGPAFWRLLERVLPESSELKSELASVGARLWFGEIGGVR
jgi:predicted metal-dependent hydrolase